MKNNKKGFTLGEVLVCVAIIGVIMAISVQSIKIVKSSYTSLAYFSFNTIKLMTAELYAGDLPNGKLKDADGNTLPSAITKCKRSDGTIVNAIKPDNEPAQNSEIPFCSQLGQQGGSQTNVFCNSLVAMSNTVGETNCDNFASSAMNNSTQEPYIADYDYDNPNFIATNGQRYYITGWAFNSDVSPEFGYRLIGVDLNGKSAPNMTDTESTSRPPDIVTFMVMDNGEVYPLGVAADNLLQADNRIVMYLNSKAKGYYYSYYPDRTEGIPQECFLQTKDGVKQTCNYAVVYLQNDEGTSFFSYREAYCKALGGKSSSYENYCLGITPSELCPPSSNDKRFDLCQVENVKPMFRYNF